MCQQCALDGSDSAVSTRAKTVSDPEDGGGGAVARGISGETLFPDLESVPNVVDDKTDDGEGESGSRDREEERDTTEDEVVNPGWRGWLCVVGAVMVNMICYGMTQSFGVFQEYYSTHLLSDSTTTAISWLGAIQFCLCPLLGCVSGPLFDAGYLKHLTAAGGTLMVFCFMMASISTEYYQLLLSHGIGVGIGMGLMFSPSVSTISHHFAKSRYRTLAYGCHASGSAVAGIIFPIMLNYLLPAVGFPWSMRILGFIVLVWSTCAFFFLSTTLPPRTEIAVLSPKVFRNIAYSIYVGGGGCVSLAIYAPVTFGVTYATSHGVNIGLANYAPAISNGVSIIGRIVPLIFAQKIGPINVLTMAAFTSSLMLFLWTLARTTPAILAFDAIYGISSGAYAASLNAGAASFAPHTNQSGLYLGMCFFTTAWFWLAGTPATAALINGSSTYLPASMFSGAVLLLGASLLLTSRTLKARADGRRAV